MKIKRLLITLLLPLLLLIIVPSLVKAAPSNNPIFATIEKVEQMIGDAIAPIQESISNLASRLDGTEDDIDDLQNRVTELENILYYRR